MTTEPTDPTDPTVPTEPTEPLRLSDLDLKAIRIAKALAADAVEKAGSGHPGTAISLAPVAYLLYQHEMPATRPTPGGWGATASSCRWGTPRSSSTSS